jgi:hypothetical protein
LTANNEKKRTFARNKNTMKKAVILISSCVILSSCTQEKTDLSNLNLNEPIENVINFNDKKLIGVETVEYPFCLLVEIENSSKYTFDGVDLKGQKVFFQINSELLKTDSITRNGGGHIDLQSFQNQQELDAILKKYKAENQIYGFRIEMKTPRLQQAILKKLEDKYGLGTKNPNTENGLYWNVKAENKYLFLAPDYDRLIVLNNTNLSKTCYWDAYNGLIDFGGCDNETYTQELIKNTTKPEDIKNKPILKIDKDWNINGLTVGKSNEMDFIQSDLNKDVEKVTSVDISSETIELIYQNEYNNVYFYFNINQDEPDNQKDNILKGYSIMDFKRVEISFENILKANVTKKDEAVKLFNKSQIANYDNLKISNYIEIRNNDYKITLIFDGDNLFNSMYLVKIVN